MNKPEFLTIIYCALVTVQHECFLTPIPYVTPIQYDFTLCTSIQTATLFPLYFLNIEHMEEYLKYFKIQKNVQTHLKILLGIQTSENI